MSYHEKHEVALPNRARSEEKTIVELLTRELDERLMAHLPRAGHVETDIAHDRQAYTQLDPPTAPHPQPHTHSPTPSPTQPAPQQAPHTHMHARLTC